MTKARTLADNFAADINGITAGTGITGGGTSGTVTVTNEMATVIDAKGDLVGGTGADAFARLAVGANGTVLTADSVETTGLKWVTPAAGGKVLQVVSAVATTETAIASTSLTDTTITATITPTLATSKVLVMIQALHQSTRNADGQFSGAVVLRDAATIMDFPTDKFGGISIGGATSVFSRRYATLIYLDSPATTSATTYKLQMSVGAGTGYINRRGVDTTVSCSTTLTVMEISA